MAPYPDTFYVAHHLFIGRPFPAEGTWGDVLDGPESDPIKVIDSLTERYDGEAEEPTRETLRVFRIAPGVSEDVTDWALEEIGERLAG
jgi:hypothetical protein